MMASLTSFFILVTTSLGVDLIASSSSSCLQREFTETPVEVQNSCDSTENLENRWRGELSYTWNETYIELHWKKIVQDWTCVKAMEFFVDGVWQKDVWGRGKEDVRINRIGEFSLKVEVYFLIPGTPGYCYGVPKKCRCFEASSNLIVSDGNGGIIHDNNQEGIVDENMATTDISLVAGAFAGGKIFLNSLVIVALIIEIIIIILSSQSP